MAAPQVQRSTSPRRRRRGWRKTRGLVGVAVSLALLAPLDLPWPGSEAAPAAVANEPPSVAVQDPTEPWPGGSAGDSFADWAPTVFIAQRIEPTVLFRVEQTVDVNEQNQTTGSGRFVRIGSHGNATYNAISYRAKDDYLYALRVSTGNLIKIGKGGHVTSVGQTTLPPDGSGWNAGTFGEGSEHEDQLFVRAANTRMHYMYKVNVDTLEATGMRLTERVPNTADLVYKDGKIWTFYQNGNVGTAFRISLEPNAQEEYQVDTFPINYGFNNLTFGAQWMYGNGNVGLSDNVSGRIFQYEILDSNSANPTFVPIFAEPLRGGSSSLNDGTSKNGPPVDLGIVKRAPASAIAGSTFEFTLEVTNHSDVWSSGFVVTDSVPAGFTQVQTLTNACNSLPMPDGTTEIKCVGGMLAPGATYEIKIRASLPHGTTECIPNTASVLGNEQEVDVNDNESTVSVCPAQPGLKVTKMLDVYPLNGAPRVGDTMRHTVLVENVGEVAYTQENPAIITDDLRDVLDDADLLAATLSATDDVGSFDIDLPRFTWSGPLPVGGSLVISYEVELKPDGDGRVRNVVFEGAGDTPECRPPVTESLPDATTRTVDQATGVPCHETEYLLPRLTISKVADLDFLPLTAGDIEYTVVVKNHGPGKATSPGAHMTDDLASLGPAVTYVAGSASAGATVVNDVLEWHGPLDVGAEQEITFTVNYDPAIEDLTYLTNTACVLERDVMPGADHCASATLQSMRTSQWKTVTSVDTPLLAGSDLTYTLHFENNGAVDFEVDAADYLGDVLDDTDFVPGSLAIDTLTAEPFTAVYDELVDGDTSTARILVAGTLLAGESATVSYRVTVKPEAERGNNLAVNFLLPSGDTPPSECVASGTRSHCTSTQLPGSLVWQKVDDRYEPLAGSEWSLTPVDAQAQPTGEPVILVTDCIGADVLACAGLRDQDPAPGGFNVVGLNYGSYLLHETASPAGFFLDTAPLAMPELDTAVLDLGDFLNFQQWVPEIPLTGGLGEDAYKIAGLLTLAMMAGLLLWRVRRTQR